MVQQPVEQQCVECDDLGVVLMASGEGFVSVPCPRCEAGRERQRQRFERAMSQSSIPAHYASMTFETFAEAMNGHPGKGKGLAFAACNMVARTRGGAFSLREAAVAQGDDWYQPASDQKTNCLILTGDYGVGKTGLAVSCANALMEDGFLLLYERVADLIDKLQSTYGKDYVGPSLEQKLLEYITIPLLILDEFEVQNYTADRLELIEKIIRGRHGAERPVLATTNIADDQVFSDQWGRRIGDIVATYHWVRVGGVKMRNTSRGVFEY